MKGQKDFTLCMPYFAKDVSNCAQIARILKLNARTVRRYKAAYQKKVPMDKVGKMGRPRKMTPAVKRQILANVRDKPHLSSTEIAREVSTEENNISARSARLYLQYRQFTKKKPRNVPRLTQKHIEARLSWAKENLNKDWSKVFFSDESFVQLFSNSLQYWTKKGGVIENPQNKDRTKVMFWAGFSVNFKSEIVFVDGTLTGEKYRGIVEKHVTPVLGRSKRCSARRGYTFQQDNDPKHTSKVVKEYLEDCSFSVMKWPACSPDLNPIENLWAIVKRKVAKRFPTTKLMLREYLIEEWAKVPRSTLENLVRSMPKRVNAVITNEGKRINF